MQFYKTYRYEEQNRKKAILNKHENNYTSKVEKRLIVTNVTEKNDIFNLSVCLNDCQKKKSTDTRKLQ